VPRVLRMFFALVLAAVLAGISIIFLGLVDASRELEASLSRLDGESVALHRATGDAVGHGAPAAAITRPRGSLKRMIDELPSSIDRIVRGNAPPYTGGVARALADALELPPAPDAISRAYDEYLEQSKQAQADVARSPKAAELAVRLLDLSHGMLAQRISEARDRTRQAMTRALNGLQLITFISIGIAALALGLTGNR